MIGDEVSDRAALVSIVAALIYSSSADAVKAVKTAVKILEESESQLVQARKK